MFNGSEEVLKHTNVILPAVFLHSVITVLCMDDFNPDKVASHSLGEFSTGMAAGALTFVEGLKLVYAHAMTTQKACGAASSTMRTIIGLADETIDDISADGNVVVSANYNSTG